MNDAGTDRKAEVELRLPADGAYASVLRTTTAGLAARLDFTLDDIEDLRIAVGEASALVMEQAVEASDLTCRFFLDTTRLTVELAVVSGSTQGPDRDSFAWQVLSTLASEAEVLPGPDSLVLRLAMDSSLDLSD